MNKISNYSSAQKKVNTLIIVKRVLNILALIFILITVCIFLVTISNSRVSSGLTTLEYAALGMSSLAILFFMFNMIISRALIKIKKNNFEQVVLPDDTLYSDVKAEHLTGYTDN